MIRSIIAACLSCFVIANGAANVGAADLTLKFSHEVPDTAIKGRTAIKFAEAVKKNSGGSIEIAIYPGGQLVAPKEEIRAAVRGQIDIIAPLINYYSSINPDWDIFYEPLLFDSVETAVQAIEGKLGDRLVDSLSNSGLVGLGFYVDGPFYVFTTDTKIVNPADLAGKKIRIPPSAPLESMLNKMGAHPIGMPASEVYLALQQGVIDGVVTTPTYAAPVKWSEVLHNMTTVIMAMGGYGAAISDVRWKKLSDEQKNIIKTSMDEAVAWNHQVALENISNSVATLASEGVEVTNLSADELKPWQDLAAQVYEEQSPEMQALIAKVKGD